MTLNFFIFSKTVKISIKTYKRLTEESKTYHDTMDIIISRLIDEVDEARNLRRNDLHYRHFQTI
jgi:hypothetical protein